MMFTVPVPLTGLENSEPSLPFSAVKNRKGAAFVEYVVLTGLIGVTAIFAILNLGGDIRNVFDDSGTQIETEIETATGISIDGGPGVSPGPGPGGPPVAFDADYPSAIVFERETNLAGPFDFAYAYESLIFEDPAQFGLPAFPEIADFCTEPDPSAPQTEWDAYYDCWDDVLVMQNDYNAVVVAAGSELANQTVWTVGAVSNNGVRGVVDFDGSTLTLEENPAALYFPSGNHIHQICGNAPTFNDTDTVVMNGDRPGNDTTELTIRILHTSMIC